MNITFPEGYDADKVTIVLKKVKNEPKPEPKPIRRLSECILSTHEPKPEPKPQPKPLVKIKAVAKIKVPIDPNRGPMARSCAFCYKPAQDNHDMCIPCQVKFRRRCSLIR
jgi:hypothetical protein